MERIINETILNVIRCGYDCDCVIGDKWLIGQNSEQMGSLFQFDPLTWGQDVDRRKTVLIEFFIGFPSEEADKYFNVDLFEQMEIVANKFIYLLRTYENAGGQQLISLTDSNWETYFDWTYNEITTSGYHITLNVTKESTTQC